MSFFVHRNITSGLVRSLAKVASHLGRGLGAPRPSLIYAERIRSAGHCHVALVQVKGIWRRRDHPVKLSGSCVGASRKARVSGSHM